MTKRTKGKYYEKKTKLYYEKKGYSVYNLESSKTIWTPKGMIFRTSDICGADLMAMNGIDIIFMQRSEERLVGKECRFRWSPSR